MLTLFCRSDSKAAASRPRSFQDFGHEKRRATDTFLLLNCAAFVLQWLSQDLLTFWGAKVRGTAHHASHCQPSSLHMHTTAQHAPLQSLRHQS